MDAVPPPARTRDSGPAAGPAVAAPAFRRDIQGLRALAVLAVVLFHAFPSAVPGGFAGVDAFFVISGFLIAGILMKELAAGTFSLRAFYIRRVRRLFPALLVLLAFAFAAAYALRPPREFDEFARTAISAVLFVSNFYFWRLTDYFAEGAAEKPLLHTWSLAVEEQFFILFPLFLFLAWRLSRRAVPATLIAALAGSFLLSEWLVRTAPTAAYFFSPARAFELLIGAVAAVAVPRWRPGGMARRVASGIGLAGLLTAFFAYGPSTPFPGISALLPCLGTALMLVAGREEPTWAGRAISGRPFQFFGNLSYSLYLWHWPILAFARDIAGFDFSPWVAAAAVAVSILCACVSYYGVERPFLDRRRDGLPFLALGAATIALVVLAGATVVLRHGLPGRYSDAALAMFAARTDFDPRRDSCHTYDHIPYDQTCHFGDASAQPDLAVWADSQGTALVVALGEGARPARRSVLAITASACPPAVDLDLPERRTCREHNRQTLASLTGDARVTTVVLAIQPDRYPDQDALMRSFETTVRSLREGGKSVIVIDPIPVMVTDPPLQVGRAVQRGMTPAELGLPRAVYQAASAPWRAFLMTLQRRYGVQVFDLVSRLCSDVRCHVFDAQAGVLYLNASHLTLAGARLVFAPLVSRLYGPA